MKTITSISLAILVIFLVGCQSYAGPTGTAVVGIGDPSVDIQGVTVIDVVVDQASIKQDGGNWVELVMLPKRLDLLQLKQSGDFTSLGVQDVPDGNYTQLRLHINSITVTDQSGLHDAKLPSNMIQIKGNMEILNGSTSVSIFDFNAADSLHKTGNGQYIFAPVLKLKISQDARLDNDELEHKGKIRIHSAQHTSEQDVGMDEKGEVTDDFKLTGDVSVDASSGKVIKGTSNVENVKRNY